ncbi:MAG: 16S rRNA (uracil(1498)-N(3))-methyltransferase [Saprospiraceae bacterium]|nr:16S rRNA (uracil(1498)-N(3))-methyltransferase [Saprospiraceae bacterium]
MRYFFAQRVQGDQVFFDKAEIMHISKSLRKSAGDKIHVLDGEGSKYLCRIVEDEKNLTVRIQQSECCAPLPYQLTMAIGITKQTQRFEWFVEKAVELGVSKIIPMRTDRGEKMRLKVDRLQRIAVSACKQSGNPYLPKIDAPANLTTVLDQDDGSTGYIAHCEKSDLPYVGDLISAGGRSLVLIGPEGDFTQQEIQMALAAGMQEISLGTLRLRTETAGIYVTTLFANINQVS